MSFGFSCGPARVLGVSCSLSRVELFSLLDKTVSTPTAVFSNSSGNYDFDIAFYARIYLKATQ